jgi:selenocysteine-specific elongation factor
MGGRLFNQVVARAVRGGVVAESEASVWSVTHEVRLTPDQRKRVDALLAVFKRAPYTTPSVAECISQLGEDVFASLLEEGTLVRISAEVVYLGETIAEMVEKVVAHIRREGDITVAQARDLFGASRKYTVALMEYLDQQRVTRRVGDARVLR